MKAIYGTAIVDGKKVRRSIVLESRFCDNCGKEFEPARQDSLYCSRQCGKIAERKRNAEKACKRAKRWYNENKERAKQRHKDYYWQNPEYWRAKTCEYTKKHRAQKRQVDNEYKDKTRHNGKRTELIQEKGLVCSNCGKKGSRHEIITHHLTFDPNDHTSQDLLCRSCHSKIHGLGQLRRKNIPKQAIIEALNSTSTLEDACKILGITRSYLRKKRLEYGLPLRESK